MPTILPEIMGMKKLRKFMQTKVCFKCQTEKALTDFYAHKEMADGHLNKCKECTKKDSKKNWQEKIEDPVWLEMEQARHRRKYHLLGYREKHKPTPEKKKGIISNYKEKYPEKHRAKNASSNLRRKLDVPKTHDLHHWNYGVGFEKDVIILPKEEHYMVHRFLVYDQPLMIYKTLDGVLLDTKEKHEDFIRQVVSASVVAA